MRPTLDIVIPVKFPSAHLNYMRGILRELPQNINVKYVLDCDLNIKIDFDQMMMKKHEHFIRGNFGSPGVARNIGLAQCKSEYVIFWDVDDEPNLSETIKLLEWLFSNDGDVGIGNWVFRDALCKLQGITPINVGMSPGIWRFLFLRKFIEDLEFTDLKWGEDQLFILRVLAKNPKIFTSESVVYRYTKHVQGALTTETKNVIDLIEVNKRGLDELSTIKDGARVCAEVMHFRQILTVLKHRKIVSAWKLMSHSILNLRARKPYLLRLFLQGKWSNQW